MSFQCQRKRMPKIAVNTGPLYEFPVQRKVMFMILKQRILQDMEQAGFESNSTREHIVNISWLLPSSSTFQMCNDHSAQWLGDVWERHQDKEG